jgi:hypothetical protein
MFVSILRTFESILMDIYMPFSSDVTRQSSVRVYVPSRFHQTTHRRKIGKDKTCSSQRNNLGKIMNVIWAQGCPKNLIQQRVFSNGVS